MEIPIWVLTLLLVLVVILLAVVVGLIFKLRQRDQNARQHSFLGVAGGSSVTAQTLSLHVPAANSATGKREHLRRATSSECSPESFVTAAGELERSSNLVLGPLFSFQVPGHTIARRGLRRPRQNTNEVWHYTWLYELLQSILDGSAAQSVLDLDTQQRGSPLFLMVGSCPNAICGMQALMYCQMPTCIDFWWVKPGKSGERLEQQTLNRHSHGIFKNHSERGRKAFLPLAEKFSNCALDGEFQFGVDSNSRAFIAVRSSSGHETRMLVYMIWQESWSMAVWGKKFIEGKICYQRASDAETSNQRLPLFARQYRIVDGRVNIDIYEEEVSEILPPEPFQEMHDMAQ